MKKMFYKIFNRTEISKKGFCITKLESDSKSSSAYQNFQSTRGVLQNIVYAFFFLKKKRLTNT